MATRKTARRENATNKMLWDRLVRHATETQDPKGEWTQHKGAWVAKEYKKRGGTYSGVKPEDTADSKLHQKSLLASAWLRDLAARLGKGEL